MKVASGLELRIERAIRDAGLSLSRVRHAAGGGVAGFDEVGSRFNRIHGLGLEGACTPEDLQVLLDFLAARGAPRPVAETSPAAHPGAESSLRALGFEIADRLPVYALRLDAEPSTGGGPAPHSDVRVEEVSAADEATLRGLVELMHFGFYPEQAEVPARTLQDGMRAARNEGADLVMAALEGRPIGGGQAVTRDGVTILYGASVLKPYRRHGAQRALIEARLRRARERGAEWVAVFCEPDSGTQRNAERLGFVEVYTRLQWRQPER